MTTSNCSKYPIVHRIPLRQSTNPPILECLNRSLLSTASQNGLSVTMAVYTTQRASTPSPKTSNMWPAHPGFPSPTTWQSASSIWWRTHWSNQSTVTSTPTWPISENHLCRQHPAKPRWAPQGSQVARKPTHQGPQHRPCSRHHPWSTGVQGFTEDVPWPHCQGSPIPRPRPGSATSRPCEWAMEPCQICPEVQVTTLLHHPDP